MVYLMCVLFFYSALSV